jgi:hypothetical protein
MNFLSEIDDRKESEEGRMLFFQNKCVSSQKIRMKKEESAAVAATPTFSQYSGPCVFSCQAGPAAFFHGRTQNSGKLPLTTENVRLTKRRRFLDIHSD